MHSLWQCKKACTSCHCRHWRTWAVSRRGDDFGLSCTLLLCWQTTPVYYQVPIPGICRSEQSLSSLHQCRLTGMLVLDLLKSTTSSLVLVVFRSKVLFCPAIEGLHKVPVLFLLSAAHTRHNSRIIRILLYVAGLWVGWFRPAEKALQALTAYHWCMYNP